MPVKKILQVKNMLMHQALEAGLSREDAILIFVLPSLRSLAQILAAKDSNTTGRDDQAARLVKAAVTGLEEYITSKPE